MPSWYDIMSFDYDPNKFEKTISIPDIKKSSERLEKVLAEEIQILNGDSKKVFLGGFS